MSPCNFVHAVLSEYIIFLPFQQKSSCILSLVRISTYIINKYLVRMALALLCVIYVAAMATVSMVSKYYLYVWGEIYDGSEIYDAVKYIIASLYGVCTVYLMK